MLDSYILTYAVLLLSFGRLGDVFGRKRMFIVGMATFTAPRACARRRPGSATWSASPGANALIAARVLQGVRRRAHDAAVAVDPLDRLPAGEARSGDGRLGQCRRHRRGHRTGHWRVDRHELRLGVDLPASTSRSAIAAILATIAIVPESIDPLATKQARLGRSGALRTGHLRAGLRARSRERTRAGAAR